jgi:hypothetical protein
LCHSVSFSLFSSVISMYREIAKPHNPFMTHVLFVRE